MILKIISNVDTFGSFYAWVYVAFDELRWTVLVNVLGNGKSPEHNDHALEEDNFSHTLPPPFPQCSLLSPFPRHSCTSSLFYQKIQTLGILPTTVL